MGRSIQKQNQRKYLMKAKYMDEFERRNTIAIFFVVGVIPLAALILSGIIGAST